MNPQASWPLLGASRGVANYLKCWMPHQVGLQCHQVAAYSTDASTHSKARYAEQASTSGRDSGSNDAITSSRTRPANKKPTSPNAAAPSPASAKPSGKPASATSPSADSPSAPSAAATAAADSHTAPSRLAQFARTILHRELMLKLNPCNMGQIPRLTSIQAFIRASETKLERDVVDKVDLLLHMLALETLTGRTAVFTSPANKNLTTRAAGVAVTLDPLTDADAAYGFVEKLVHVILPNQVGFEGVAPPTPVEVKYRSDKEARLAARAASLDHRPNPPRAFATQLRIQNLLPYPDFEQNFAMFEPLAGMRVRLVMEGTNAADCTALLTGLSVPVLSGAAAEAAVAAQAAEAEAEARKNYSGMT